MKRTMAALLALLAIGLTACGDSPETKAVKALNKAQDNTGAQILAHAGDISGASTADAAAHGIADQVQQLRTLADKIGETDVPDSARSTRDALVTELRSTATLTERWKSDPTFHNDMTNAQQRIKQTVIALNRELGR